MSATFRNETWNPGLYHGVEPASDLNSVDLVNGNFWNLKVKGYFRKAKVRRVIGCHRISWSGSSFSRALRRDLPFGFLPTNSAGLLIIFLLFQWFASPSFSPPSVFSPAQGGVSCAI